MDVTVDVKGEAVSEVSVSAGATYADLLDAVDLSPQEATVLVDERPVPVDQPVASEHVTVLRLVKGG
jgi:sulfur carrier protein